MQSFTAAFPGVARYILPFKPGLEVTIGNKFVSLSSTAKGELILEKSYDTHRSGWRGKGKQSGNFSTDPSRKAERHQ